MLIVPKEGSLGTEETDSHSKAGSLGNRSYGNYTIKYFLAV